MIAGLFQGTLEYDGFIKNSRSSPEVLSCRLLNVQLRAGEIGKKRELRVCALTPVFTGGSTRPGRVEWSGFVERTVSLNYSLIQCSLLAGKAGLINKNLEQNRALFEGTGD